MTKIIKATVLRPSGDKWTVGDYIKRILSGLNIDEWKNEHGDNWEYELKMHLSQGIAALFAHGRLFIDFKTEEVV